MEIKFDPAALAGSIIDALISGLTKLVSPLPQNFLDWLALQISNLWNGMWSSGANLLDTPFELTLNYPPAQMLGRSLAVTIYVITALAIILLGLRHLWRSFSGGNSILNDGLNGVLIGIMFAGGSTIIVGQSYALVGAASSAIGRFNYTPAFDPHKLTYLISDFLTSLVALTLMMVYGWKLLMRAAYRIVLLMFLTPFAPVAGILYGIPQTRWIAVSYYITLGGWLAGGFLAIGAVSLGVQIAGAEIGILAVFFGVAMIQLAYDLMVILPRWAFGSFGGGSNFNPASLIGAAVFSAAGGAAGAAVGGYAGASSASVMGALGTRAAGAALSPAALGPGYD